MSGTAAVLPGRRMPVVFIGHGSPMNAVADNRWSRAMRAFGEQLPKPRAILCISAHWYVQGTFVTGSARPETIHDFSGFPRDLYQVEYPAPGDVELASHVSDLLASVPAPPSADRGLDHGTWSVLRHLRPDSDVPVLQLSIDRRLRPVVHVSIAQLLAPLRDEGVLILGSGNVVHNLRHAMAHMGEASAETPAWAADFDAKVAQAILRRDQSALAHALDDDLGLLAHPTPDHYLPLLYAFGASRDGDAASFPIEGFDAGSLSMRAVRFG